MSWQSEVLIDGEAQGAVLRFDAPISFWGGIDPVSSKVTLAGHPQHGEAIAGTILVLPQLIGSSSSSGIMLELVYKRMAPRAVILGARDAILPLGVLVAREMGWSTIPIVLLPDPPFLSGTTVSIGRNGAITAA